MKRYILKWKVPTMETEIKPTQWRVSRTKTSSSDNLTSFYPPKPSSLYISELENKFSKGPLLQDMILSVVRFLALPLKLPSMHPYELTRSSNNCIKINEKIRQKKIKNSAFLKKFSKSWRTDPDPESRIQIRIKIIWILITGKLTNSYLIYRLPWKPILLVICGFSQLTTSLSETFLKLTWWYMICHLSKLTNPISDK